MPLSPGIFSTRPKGAKPSTLQGLLREKGWEEVRVLGIGARGPVLLIKRERDSGLARHSALKRSSHEEVSALKALSQCKRVMGLEEHFSSPSANDMVWARLEWLDGGNLRGFLRGQRQGGGTIAEDVSRFIIGEVLEGLVEIHRLGWTHRDIKAENIGISRPATTSSGRLECEVKLLDFDTAARIPSPPLRLTEILGTVENMAPEVFGGWYDEKADCWSLGVLAFEMLFGYRPFNDACIEQVEEMVRNWQQYLIIPYDASQSASSFLQRLLVGTEERFSSAQATSHCWLQGAKNSVALVATAVADVLLTQEYASGSLNADPCRSGMVKLSSTPSLASPSSPKFARWEKAQSLERLAQKYSIPTASSPSTSVLDGDGGDGDILRRMRSSLAEWSAPCIESIFDDEPGGRVRSSEPAPTAKGRPPMDVLGSEALPWDFRSSHGRATAPTAFPIVARYTAPSIPQDCLAACAGDADGVGRGQESEAGLRIARNGIRRHGVDEDDALEYLKSVRARTQAVVQAAGAISDAVGAMQAAKSRAASITPSDFPSAASPMGQAVPSNIIEPNISRSHDTTDAQTSLEPHSQSELTHLEESRQRIKNLLSRFSTGTADGAATSLIEPSQSQGVSSQNAAIVSQLSIASALQPEPEPMTLSSPFAQDMFSVPLTVSSPFTQDEPEDSSSPETWLVKQKQRTEKLLGRLRQASETTETGTDIFPSQGIHASPHDPSKLSRHYSSATATPKAARPVCVWV